MTVEILPKHVAMVRKIARTLHARAPHASFDDMVGDGLLALVVAARTFDPSRGVPADLYLWGRARHRMIDGMREADFVPHSVRGNARRADLARAHLTPAGSSTPADDATVAAWLGVPLRKVTTQPVRLLSLDCPSRIFEDGAADDTDEGTEPSPLPGPEELTAEHEAGYQLRAIVSLLRPRQRYAISCRLAGHPLKVIAKRLRVDESRVSQLVNEAVRGIRKVMRRRALRAVA